MTRPDRGSATVELVLTAPIFALMLALVVTAGRVQTSRADIEAAAHAAARTITLARDPATGIDQARADAEAMLPLGSPTCRSMGWATDITDQRAIVAITCTIDLADAAMLPVPTSYTVAATAEEVFDVHREKGDEFGLSEGFTGSNSGAGVL